MFLHNFRIQGDNHEKVAIFELMVVFFGIFLAAGTLCPHCEIPCGIYDDKMRIDMITEDIAHC